MKIWHYLLFLNLLISCSKKDEINFQQKLSVPYTNEDITQRFNSRSLSTIDLDKNIFLIIVDTLRNDYVTSSYAPNLLKFKKRYINFGKSFSNSTSTHHSLYSLFLSRPPYERNLHIKNSYHQGSPFIKYFKEVLKYQIHPFSQTDWIYCNSTTIPTADNLSDNANMQIIFGVNTYLLDSCNNSTTTTSTFTPTSTHASKDHWITNRVIDHIKANPNATKNFYIIHLTSPHDPYSWLDEFVTNYEPNMSNNFINLVNPTQRDISILKNSYKMAVQSADYQISRLFAAMKNTSSTYFKDSIILITSDHGENLYDNGATTYHGGPAHRPVTEIYTALKMYDQDENNNSNYSYLRNPDLPEYSFSLVDVFPTLMDILGIDNYGQDLFFGKSILLRKETSVVIIPPKLEKDLPEFVLQNEKYKVWCRLNYSGNIHDSQSFDILYVTDLNDNPLEIKIPKIDFQEQVKNDFSNILSRMFNR